MGKVHKSKKPEKDKLVAIPAAAPVGDGAASAASGAASASAAVAEAVVVSPGLVPPLFGLPYLAQAAPASVRVAASAEADAVESGVKDSEEDSPTPAVVAAPAPASARAALVTRGGSHSRGRSVSDVDDLGDVYAGLPGADSVHHLDPVADEDGEESEVDSASPTEVTELLAGESDSDEMRADEATDGGEVGNAAGAGVDSDVGGGAGAGSADVATAFESTLRNDSTEAEGGTGDAEVVAGSPTINQETLAYIIAVIATAAAAVTADPDVAGAVVSEGAASDADDAAEDDTTAAADPDVAGAGVGVVPGTEDDIATVVDKTIASAMIIGSNFRAAFAAQAEAEVVGDAATAVGVGAGDNSDGEDSEAEEDGVDSDADADNISDGTGSEAEEAVAAANEEAAVGAGQCVGVCDRFGAFIGEHQQAGVVVALLAAVLVDYFTDMSGLHS